MSLADQSAGNGIKSADWNKLLDAIGDGNPAGPCMYTVFFDAATSTYKARNGQTGIIDYSGTNPSTVINAALAASGQVHLKGVTYTLTSELLAALTGTDTTDAVWADNPVIIEGEGDDTVLYAATAINIIHFTRTDSMRANLIVRNLRISGNALATGINLSGAVYGVADQHFENVFIYNCAKGVTGAMCDTKLDNVKFHNCALGLEIMQSGVNLYSCRFRLCETAVSFNNASPSQTGFYGCVFSGCNYSFNFEQTGHTLACYTCWFENSGEQAGDLGNAAVSGILTTSMGGTTNAIRPILFSQCYFSEYENFGMAWIEPEYWRQMVRFEGCNFTFFDDFTKFDRGSGFYPQIRACVGYNTGATFWIMDSEWHGNTAGIADGGTIPHDMNIQPSWVLLTGTIAGEIVTVTGTSSTTITVAIKKHDGSAGTTQAINWRAGFA